MFRVSLTALLLTLALPITNLVAQDGPSLDETIQYIAGKINGSPEYLPILKGGVPAEDNDSVKSRQTQRVTFQDGKLCITRTTITNFLGNQYNSYQDVTWTIIDRLYVPLSRCSSNVTCSKNSVFPNRSYVTVMSGKGDSIFFGTENWNKRPMTKTGPFANAVVAVFDYDPDLTEAKSVANALRHAIELSGGKADPFAPTSSP